MFSSLLTVFVIVIAHHTFQRTSKINFKTREIANLLFSLYGRETWSFSLHSIFKPHVVFSRFFAKLLREVSDLQQVCFEINLYLTREPKKAEVVKNGEHYTKRKYVIYTSSSSLLWYRVLGS
jgi:hypothetical protein